MPEENPSLFLIDGNSMAYRAFFALPDSMATADGRPTNAIFGLASMLVKLIADYRPRQIAVAWDAGMSGREVVYPEYKSHRPPKPDLLRQQWPQLLEMVEAFGYTNVKVDGYEADDVIATLEKEGVEAEATGPVARVAEALDEDDGVALAVVAVDEDDDEPAKPKSIDKNAD